MWPDRVLNPGPLALQSDALPTATRPGPLYSLLAAAAVARFGYKIKKRDTAKQFKCFIADRIYVYIKQLQQNTFT